MDATTLAALGASGGALVQFLDFAGKVADLEQARYTARHRKRPVSELRTIVDPPIDVLVLITRLALGAIAGYLFHDQVTGPTATVAVVAAAPALLRQLVYLRNAEAGTPRT